VQVLVSLQAMVFCAHPWFNEPGYERSAGTANGDRQSEAYNSKLREHTAQHAILDCLNKPDAHPHGVFKDVLALHWRAKASLMKAYLRKHKPPRGKEICAKLDQSYKS
jgi:ubiquitin-conjugating enzyme E2 O